MNNESSAKMHTIKALGGLVIIAHKYHSTTLDIRHSIEQLERACQRHELRPTPTRHEIKKNSNEGRGERKILPKGRCTNVPNSDGRYDMQWPHNGKKEPEKHRMDPENLSNQHNVCFFLWLLCFVCFISSMLSHPRKCGTDWVHVRCCVRVGPRVPSADRSPSHTWNFFGGTTYGTRSANLS